MRAFSSSMMLYCAGMQIKPLGDSALLIRVAEAIDDESLGKVQAALARLEELKLPGEFELVPSYGTIALFYDPVAIVSLEKLAEEIRAALTEKCEKEIGGPRLVEIPVCYDAEFGIDLEIVARNASLSIDEVVRFHSAAAYRVACIGFTPGFPYLIGLPPQLATPRRATPRKEVPGGSVAIGGAQTGIYPRKSPGGWNVIGRTPQRLFDLSRERPALLEVGDQVRLCQISRRQFDDLWK